ncbi:tyrosine-type recombinase/integrase [Mesorhizobium sp. LNHC221B00]|uniref:tyrosine-type recombinase/integrase n=1 Tax=Mesorhizobium sp. LNHC221B00 TaxID=1287233 RepID=UPI00247820FF|nr:tyrosine-type recombinase/integrase [Mesorhizobium sp. LNHC221B00]
MIERTDAGHSAGRYHDDAPFAEERHRYLRHCAERGATPASLRVKCSGLLWIASRLSPAASEGIDIKALQQIAIERQQALGSAAAAQRVVHIGRPWLRFLGWWREPTVVSRYRSQLEEYVRWMRDERGFTPSTVEQWTRVIGRFLRWCEETDRQLRSLQPEDVDAYFVARARQWSRVSVANIASALRGFLRYAAERGMCIERVAASISRPQLYQQERLPYAPDGSDVQRILADAETDKPREIRDRAILLLLAVCGMRSGEVAALRLDQIDWAGGTLRLFRLKRRQPQIYPLVPSAAEALARYIDTARPLSADPQVFLCMQALVGR